MKSCIVTFVLLLSINIYSIDFWQQTNGPYGSTVMCMEYSPSGSIFCGTFTGGGIYKSTNNGAEWFKVLGDNRNSWAWVITTDKFGNLYAGCSGHGIIKSTDDGITWLQLSSTITPQAIAVNSNGDIFAGLSAGHVFRSTNNGINWVSVNFGANGVRKILIKPNGYVFAAFPPYVNLSTDNGTTWNRITPMGMAGANDMSLDSSGNVLICNSNGIFKTSNDGVNWQQICSEGSLLSIAVAGDGAIYAGNDFGTIIKSTDNGLSWLKLFSNISIGGNSGVMDILIKPDEKLFAGYYYLGVFGSFDNGLTWNKINNRLSNQRISVVKSSGSGRIYAGSFNDGLYYTTNNGDNWINAGFENKYPLQIGFNGDQNIFVYTPNLQGGLYRSTNGGATWEDNNNNGIPQGNVYQFLNINNSFFAASQSGIYKTTNNGINWVLKNINASRFRNIKENSDHIIFASTESRLYRSSDMGESWQALDSLGYFIQGYCVYNNNVYCISSSRLYRSTNLGINWVIADSTANFSNLTCNNLGVLFVSDWDGIYRSMDFGSNWEQINTGLLFTDITSLNFDEQGFLYAGTWGAGVFRSTLSTVNITTTGNQSLPDKFSISQNYPNPFNPVTNIKFEIPKTGFVKITVFDMLGKVVTTLVNQQLQPGSYNVYWDASNYPSGVYFYKIEVKNTDKIGVFSDSRKMVLIK